MLVRWVAIAVFGTAAGGFAFTSVCVCVCVCPKKLYKGEESLK